MENCSVKTMSSDPNHSLEEFVERFLADRGAAIEKRESYLDVLSPRQLAQRIGIPDYCSLTVGSGAPEGLSVNYGSPLLEKIIQAAGAQIPLAIVRLRFHYLKSQGFDRLVKDVFTFRGAIVQVDNTAEVLAEYLLLTCRYLAQSDEQKEGLISLAFNLETGALVGNLEEMLDTTEKAFEPDGRCKPFEAEKIEAITQWVGQKAPHRVEAQIQPFRDSMNRRFSRDVANLEAYYAELKQEMTDNLSRSGLSEQLIQERKEKIALIPEEMAKKKDDLFKKYSIKVKIELSGAILIRTPAVKLYCKAAVGRHKKTFTLFYNPIDKSLDPLVCEGCGHDAVVVHFCGQFHLLCPRCIQHCPVCAGS
jgi:hypothetical protein